MSDGSESRVRSYRFAPHREPDGTMTHADWKNMSTQAICRWVNEQINNGGWRLVTVYQDGDDLVAWVTR